MAIKLRDIKGLILNNHIGITILLDKEGKEYCSAQDHFKWGWNKAINAQGEKSIGINKDKLIDILLSIKEDDRVTGNIAESIISREKEILESKP